MVVRRAFVVVVVAVVGCGRLGFDAGESPTDTAASGTISLTVRYGRTSTADTATELLGYVDKEVEGWRAFRAYPSSVVYLSSAIVPP